MAVTNLPIVQSLWVGELSRLERLCVQSFIDHGHEFHLYVYDNVKDIPANVVVKDANKILLKERIYINKDQQSIAQFSDWFRYELLAKRGGFWVDMDLLCLRPLDFESDIVFGGYFSGLLKFPKSNQCMRYLADYCANTSKPENTMPMYFYNQFEIAIKKFGLQKYAQPITIFRPLRNKLFHNLYGIQMSHTQSENIADTAYVLHFVNSDVRRLLGDYSHKNKYSKNASFPSNSLYEHFMRKHNIAPVANETIFTADDMEKLKTYVLRKKMPPSFLKKYIVNWIIWWKG